MKFPAGLALAAVTLFIAGCSVEINQGDEDAGQIDVATARTQLEQTVSDQLPQQIKKTTGIYGYVSETTCTSTGGTAFDCIATVETSNGRGYPVTERIPVSGACDSENCTWRSGP